MPRRTRTRGNNQFTLLDGPRVLSALCRKTKMCAFFRDGDCARGAECSYAHGLDELHVAPDLGNTRLCPDLLRHGTCDLQGRGCPFAHSEEHVRLIEGVDTAKIVSEQVFTNTSGWFGAWALPTADTIARTQFGLAPGCWEVPHDPSLQLPSLLSRSCAGESSQSTEDGDGLSTASSVSPSSRSRSGSVAEDEEHSRARLDCVPGTLSLASGHSSLDSCGSRYIADGGHKVYVRNTFLQVLDTADDLDDTSGARWALFHKPDSRQRRPRSADGRLQ